MKRDLNLIRAILLQCEKDPNGSSAFDGYTQEQVRYHAAMLIDKGYIDGRVLRDDSPIPACVKVNNLTWQGHEFIDDIRNDTVWSKTKEAVGNQFQTISLAVVQELAKNIVRGLIGLPLAL